MIKTLGYRMHPVTKRILLAFFTLWIIYSFGSYAFNASNEIREKHSVEAMLMNAYKTIEYNGQGSSAVGKEIFKGRLKENTTGQYFERDIDIFFYHKFKEKGEVPLPAYLLLSKKDLGVKIPFISDFGGFLSAISILIGIIFLFVCICMVREWKKIYDKNHPNQNNII